MSRQEDFIDAGIAYRMKHSKPMCIAGSNLADVANEMNRTKPFEDGAEYGYQYAQTHPNWISVEEELPPHRNQTKHKFENDFSVNCFVSDGKDVDTGYYDYRLRKWNCEFLTNVVYWYCPQPPRKEDNNE